MLTTTNVIQDTIEKNNIIFAKKWEAMHDRIDLCLDDILLLKNQVVDLEAPSSLQQTTLQSCQNTIAGLEETIVQLTTLVTKLEKMVYQYHDQLLSPGPHYMPGEEEEDEEEGLKYTTDTPSGGSYTTPPSLDFSGSKSFVNFWGF